MVNNHSASMQAATLRLESRGCGERKRVRATREGNQHKRSVGGNVIPSAASASRQASECGERIRILCTQ